MKYAVKWVEDNLGITRKALRYYESKGLMPTDESRNPENNYREYNDDDIERIWSIKILQGIGYSVNEIRELIENPDADFYSSISEKVEELERKRDEIIQYIEFAKSIKLTGRVPTTKQVGSIRYEDFIKYAHKNWNFYDGPKAAPLLDTLEEVLHPAEQEWSDTAVEKLKGLAEILSDYQETQRTCTINAYYRIIADMYHLDYRSDTVQTVVQLLYSFLSEQDAVKEIGNKFNPHFFAKYTAPFFLEGSDISRMNEVNYGKEGCRFIAETIAYFGGFEALDDLYEL